LNQGVIERRGKVRRIERSGNQSNRKMARKERFERDSFLGMGNDNYL